MENKEQIPQVKYLSRLLELYEKNISESKPNYTVKPVSNNFLKLYNEITGERVIEENFTASNLELNKHVTPTNVYINPNFKLKNPTIHMNPKVRINNSVHINPNIIKAIPKLYTNAEHNSLNTIVEKSSSNQEPNMKKSIYVNPKLMIKLKSEVQLNTKLVKNENINSNEDKYLAHLKSKSVKNVSFTKLTPKKINNSGILILSKQKLIRVKCKCNVNPTEIKSQTIVKKAKILPQKHIRISPYSSNKRIIRITNSNSKQKLGKYKIDRTSSQKLLIAEKGINKNKTDVQNVGLVNIAGVLYKSSRNCLIRRSYSPKVKHIASNKINKFIVTANGKKLKRNSLKLNNSQIPNSSVKANDSLSKSHNLSSKFNIKKSISDKVKQRSLQILRNKMSKNNQPCLIFQKFGYCSNYQKGICSKLHDKKQVSLCKNFLLGECLLDKCLLSHDVGPEKMPTCKYFLEGCCVRESCPYLHVKLSSTTSICIEFLKGYCANGSKCQKRHEHICPEFDKTGTCIRGKFCPYPHNKKKPNKPRKIVKQNNLNSKIEISETENFLDDIFKNITENPSKLNNSNTINRQRYYEKLESLNGDVISELNDENQEITLNDTDESEESEESDGSNKKRSISDSEYENVRKRPLIGDLPSYIPI